MFIKKSKTVKKVATLGPLIHNRQVIEDLASKGVYAYDEVLEDSPSDHNGCYKGHTELPKSCL